MNTAVSYLCANPAHRPSEDVAQPFVRHRGAFGYCPLGAAADHDWRAASPGTNNWSATVGSAFVRAGGRPERDGVQR